MMFYIQHYLYIGLLFAFAAALIELMAGGTKRNVLIVFAGGVPAWPLYAWLYMLLLSSELRRVNK